ncbi:hypothetical protein BRADI_3g43285v3 [Brachypodium distachyon]|uniref:Uncharacterized protein n=1 Tax=Brachypodium distachyon TaxID=15368 RepID=A0A0Q3QCD7_BRADI|nr:hypothetical protein BRADI_3g43285v3 [Brachypodium distachyon]
MDLHRVLIRRSGKIVGSEAYLTNFLGLHRVLSCRACQMAHLFARPGSTSLSSRSFLFLPTEALLSCTCRYRAAVTPPALRAAAGRSPLPSPSLLPTLPLSCALDLRPSVLLRHRGRLLAGRLSRPLPCSRGFPSSCAMAGRGQIQPPSALPTPDPAFLGPADAGSGRARRYEVGRSRRRPPPSPPVPRCS